MAIIQWLSINLPEEGIVPMERLEKYYRESRRDWVTGRISIESINRDRLSLRNELESCSILTKYIPRHARVLEAGCGTGQWVYFLKEKGYDVIGIENSKILVEQLNDMAPGCPVEYGDAFHLHYDDACFGAYLSFGVIEHFEDYPSPQLQILSEAHRVLKQGGLIMVTVPILTPLYKLYKVYHHFLFWRVRHIKRMRWVRRLLGIPVPSYFDCYFFSRRQFRNLLTQANFQIIGERPLSHLAGIIYWGGGQYFRASTDIEIEKQVTSLGKILNFVNKIYPWFSPQICLLVGMK